MVFGGFSSISSGYVQNGVKINSTTYWGPSCATASSQPAASSKVQIFSLNSGDTIEHMVQQTSGSTLSMPSAVSSTTPVGPPTMLIAYLGAQGAPATLPTVPDLTYLYQAGTPSSQMATLLNNHVINDLNFLIQRPYNLAWQHPGQTGIVQNTATTVQNNNATDIVRGGSFSSYGGWNSSTWTYIAPVSGWYLAVQETFLVQPTSPTNPTVRAAFTLSAAGINSPDYYNSQNYATASGAVGGASAVAIYYLRAGDAIAPQVLINGWGSGAQGATFASASPGQNPHFECIWLSS
jgi:hypothetical protein